MSTSSQVRMRHVAALVALVTAIAGCGASAASPISTAAPIPRVVRDRSPLPSCGTENATTPIGPWNPQARQCFLDAYLMNEPAEFVSTRPTTEGDPITTISRVVGPGRIVIYEDMTHDRYSTRTWLELDCRSLALIATVAGQLDFGPDASCTETAIQ